MKQFDHPDSEQLTAYLRAPQANDYRDLRLHLVNCRDCRQQVNLLSDLHNNLPVLDSDQHQQAVAQHNELHEVLQSQLIEKYVDGQLSQTERQRVKRLLDENPQAMKAAIHYTVHSNCMPRELAGDSGSPALAGSGNADADRPVGKLDWLSILRRCLHVRTPLWLTVPTTATVASLLSLMLISQPGSYTQNDHIVAYQDNPVIQFKPAQALPGIGFFSNANKISKPYGKISAGLSRDKQIQLAWPGVDNALSYTVQLKIFRDGKPISVGKLTTTMTQASFSRADNDTGHRYVWQLTGKTGDERVFSTRGGFIINSVSH